MFELFKDQAREATKIAIHILFLLILIFLLYVKTHTFIISIRNCG